MTKKANQEKSSSSKRTSLILPSESHSFKLKPIMKLSEIPTDANIIVHGIYGIVTSASYCMSMDSEGREQLEFQYELIDDEFHGSVTVTVFRDPKDPYITPEIGDIVKIWNLKGKSGYPIYLWTRVANEGNGQIVVFNVDYDTCEYCVSFSSLPDYEVTVIDELRIIDFDEFLKTNPDKLITHSQTSTEYDLYVEMDKPLDKSPHQYCQANPDPKVATELDKIMHHLEKLMEILPGTSKGKLPNLPPPTIMAAKRSYYGTEIESPVPVDSVKVVTHKNPYRTPWIEILSMPNPPPSSIGQELKCGAVTTFDQVQEKKFHNHFAQVIAVFVYQGKTYLRIWDGTKLKQKNVWNVPNEKISHMYRWESDLLVFTKGYSIDIQVYDTHEDYVKSSLKPRDLVYLHNVGFLKWNDHLMFKMPGSQGPNKNLPPESRDRRIQLMHESNPETAELITRLAKIIRAAFAYTMGDIKETGGEDEDEEASSKTDRKCSISTDEVTGTHLLNPGPLPALTKMKNKRTKPRSRKN